MIETFRGKGIYQEAIDFSAKKLDEGKWVRSEILRKGTNLPRLRRINLPYSFRFISSQKVE